ncbi:MAG: RNA methyltransferase [Planctomycetales bacterium]|nr:RNA methyltransferase [Planctomycetales bacterium]
MPEPILINELADERLDPYRNLRHSDSAGRRGLFVAEGYWLAQRLLQSDYEVHSVVCEQRRVEEIRPHLRSDTPLLIIPDKAAPDLVGFNFHRGVLACGVRPAPVPLQQLIPDAPARQATIVLCCRIQDPENIGLILRNCAAFGVDGLVLGPACVDPYSRRVLRVSMGNAFFTPIVVVESLEEAIRDLGSWEFDIAATVLDEDAEPLMTARRQRRQGIVMGEEAHGVTTSCVAACTRRLTLPMANHTDSLNVAVASAIFLYQLTTLQGDR